MKLFNSNDLSHIHGGTDGGTGGNGGVCNNPRGCKTLGGGTPQPDDPPPSFTGPGNNEPPPM